MRAGKLRHRITIQEYTTAANDFGEMVKTWATYVTVWGLIKPLTGDEKFTADQTTPGLSHEIRIRYKSGITPDMQLRFDGRTFGIVSVINIDERNREMILMCREIL